MWDVIKWILIIWFGPDVLAWLLRFGAQAALILASWLDKWPL